MSKNSPAKTSHFNNLKSAVTGGVGALCIAVLGMLISVMTGWINLFDAYDLIEYVGVCLLLAGIVFWREKLLRIESETAQLQAKAERDALLSKQVALSVAQGEANKAREEFAKKQNDLIEIMRMMPPANSMKTLAVALQKLSIQCRMEWTRSRYNEYNPELVKNLVRQALNALCELMRDYHYDNEEAEFSANLMLYLPIDEVQADQELKTRVESIIRFVDKPKDSLAHLAGVLMLETELSASTREERIDSADSSLTPLALPIPNLDDGNSYEQNAILFIPVAPMAANQGETYYQSVDILTREKGYENMQIRPVLRDQLIAYFRKKQRDSAIGSVLSVRIGSHFDQTQADPLEEQCCYGVLNLHSTAANSLNNSMIKSFIHCSTPVIELVKDLLVLLGSAPDDANKDAEIAGEGH